MKPRKLAMIFPYAPAYRGPIYELMDQTFDIDWYFCGNDVENLKMYDYSRLKHYNTTLQKKSLFGPVHYYKGIKDIPVEKYDCIIMPGVIRSLSIWYVMNRIQQTGSNTKVYLWTHGWYGRESRFQIWLKQKFYKKCDGVLLYGNYAKNLMIEHGFCADNLHLIYNSLDYDKELSIRENLLPSEIYRKHFNNDNPVIVFIGRLTFEKKLDTLLYSLKRMNDAHQLINLVLIGDGEAMTLLKQKAKSLGIDNQVWLYGACYDEERNAELIYNADLCVSPGNVGLTAIHCLMFGVPVITHNDFKYQGPEFEAIRPAITGDFFEKDNILSLTNCILNWIKTKRNEREEIRKSCYEEIDSKWNPHYQINLIHELLEQE